MFFKVSTCIGAFSHFVHHPLALAKNSLARALREMAKGNLGSLDLAMGAFVILLFMVI